MLEVVKQNETLVIDSRLIAEELGIEHRSFKDTITRYKGDLEEFAELRLETAPSKAAGGGGFGETYYWLNEDQTYFVMTLSRNTEQVIKAKKNLILAFKKAREQLDAKIPQNYIEALESLLTSEKEKEKLKLVNGVLQKENSKLVETVNKVHELKNFKYFFDLTINELSDNDYRYGVSAYQYIDEWNKDPKHLEEQIDLDDRATIAKRAAGFFRSVEEKDPDKNKYGRTFYKGKKVAYIIATIKLVLEGI